jgi:hypothetical protein
MPKKNGKKQQKQQQQGRNALLASAMRKNVTYSFGIPRKVLDLERVYQITLISPLVNLTFSAGSLASALSLDPTVRIDTWSRWSAVFRQFIVTGITCCTTLNRLGTAQGQVFTRIEESSAVPTSAIVRAERGIINLVNYQDEEKDSTTARWSPRSAEDVTWTDTGIAYNIAYLKTYADSTNTGTAAADSTTIVTHTIFYHVAFRYFA